MIELPVPKDISQYESKLIGPLTARQTAAAVAAGALVIAVQKFAPIENKDVKMTLSIIVAVLPFLFTLKIYGVYMEKFIRTAFISMVLAPNVRKYRTRNLFDEEKPLTSLPPTFYMSEEEKEEYQKAHTSPKGKPIKVKITKKYVKEHPELMGYN